MPRFDIDFADPKGFFYPGETIVGSITVKLDKAILCRKVTLQFKGESYVRWKTGSGESELIHTNSEEYFNKIVFLLEPSADDTEQTLHAGEFCYPFQFTLPNYLPPSINLGIGYVWYYMKIKIHMDRKWKIFKSDRKERRYFKVGVLPLDFNRFPRLLEPATDTEEKFLCCLCCQSGPIRISGKIQKRAYYLGEQIVFSFEVDNKETGKPLRKIEARLIEELTCISSANDLYEFKSVKSSVLISEGVPPRSEESWNDVTLNIPTNILPSFSCKCASLDYRFEVNVGITLAFNPSVSFPITISSGPQIVQPVSCIYRQAQGPHCG